jgi:large subunit ribosomal protein L10
MAIKAKKVQPAKAEAIEALKDAFQDVPCYIFTEYRGLTVAQITELRNQLRGKNASFKVVKNNFATIAFGELSLPSGKGFFTGPTAVAIAKDDAGEVAKALFEFAKETPLKVKGGVIDKQVFDVAQVEAFSKLPGKKQLIAMLMSAMNGPAQNLVYVLNAIPTKLVRVLKAVEEKKAAGA